MDLNLLMQQAQGLQARMGEVQAGLASKRVTGSAGGGMVTVTATGRSELVAIEIDDAVLNPDDKEMLQDLVVAAVNDAVKKAARLAQDEFAAVTGGFHIPGLGG